MPIYGICVCNVVMVMGKKDYMWESPGNSHAVAIYSGSVWEQTHYYVYVLI